MILMMYDETACYYIYRSVCPEGTSVIESFPR